MDYKDKYKQWIECADEKTRAALAKMDEKQLYEAFYGELEFGTGGLRGIMEPGTDRMNIYTVRRATQGLANEIIDLGEAAKKSGVVIAHDSRNNSRLFAEESAKVLCANGIKTYLFEDLRPTPELSFAVRYLGCVRGIVITASHNPKEYNGYKVYGEDGGQISPVTADKITGYIKKTDIFGDVKLCDNPNYTVIGEDVDKAYIEAVKGQSMNVAIPEELKLIYTPLHGSGNKPVRWILSEIGVKNLFVVPEQEAPDGNFPTVITPNPENPEAFSIATEYAKKQNADLIIGTDPDSDRVGALVKSGSGDYTVLNGNQTGMLLCEFILRKMRERGELGENCVVVKTIVTTELVRKIAEDFGAEVCDVLTGFKYIGEKIKEFEKSGEKRFIFGLEESYGYLKGTYARDKDAVVASMLIAEMAADYKAKGMTLYDGLMKIYEKYGRMTETLKTITLTGVEGSNRIKAAMERLRTNPPAELAGFRVKEIKDYSKGIDGIPRSDVLKFITENGWCAVRPSGTEPKIKFYFGTDGEDSAAAENMYQELEKNV